MRNWSEVPRGSDLSRTFADCSASRSKSHIQRAGLTIMLVVAVRLLSPDDLKSLLSMKEAIDVVEEAFRQLATGTIQMPLRSRLEIREHEGWVAVMPALIERTGAIGLKVVSTYPANPTRHNLPTTLATILMVDAATGAVSTIMDGAFITALRTGAVSGIATKYLARQDSRVAAILGSGVQAETQLAAIVAVREIEKARVYDTVVSRREDYAQRMSRELGIDVAPSSTAEEAVKNADIIATATTARSPVIHVEWIQAGTHINSIGAPSPDARELDDGTIRKSRITVDLREAALKETGDLVVPILKGIISAADIAELGEIVTGKESGRIDSDETTIFKSVGLAMEDVAVAQEAYQKASERGLGTNLLSI